MLAALVPGTSLLATPLPATSPGRWTSSVNMMIHGLPIADVFPCSDSTWHILMATYSLALPKGSCSEGRLLQLPIFQDLPYPHPAWLSGYRWR